MKDEYSEALHALANECYQIAGEAIINSVRTYPDQKFFAAGFHTLYIDGTFFGGYRFGLGSDDIKPPYRWSGSEWCAHEWGDLVDFPAYNRLSALLDGSPESDWDDVQRIHDEQLSSVCLRLTMEARESSGMFTGANLQEFVVGIFDDNEGEVSYHRRVAMSVSAEDIQRLNIGLS